MRVVRADDLAIGIAAHEPGPRLERQELIECLAVERASRDVTADKNEVDALARDIRQHRLKCGKVAVNVVQRRDPHAQQTIAHDARRQRPEVVRLSRGELGADPNSEPTPRS